MVTAKIIRTEFSYPVLSVFVNFSDDQNKLDQPQVQQISFSGETLNGLDNASLEEKIKEYINMYEGALTVSDAMVSAIDKEFTKDGEVVK